MVVRILRRALCLLPLHLFFNEHVVPQAELLVWSHMAILPYEIKLDISDRINGIVNYLHKLGNSVREVLHLEISSSIAIRNQNQYVATNTCLTTSVPIEDKVYGRDTERDKIIELLINGKSKDLQVLPMVGLGGVGNTTLARLKCFLICDSLRHCTFVAVHK